MTNNFRDVAASTNSIRKGLLYRSGNVLRRPDVLKRPPGQRDITRILDLRSGDEYERDDAWLSLATTIRTFSPTDGTIREQSNQGERSDKGNKGGETDETVVFRVSLLEKRKVIQSILWKLPLVTALKALGLKLIGDDEGLRNILVPVVNDIGLSLVYTTMLDTSRAEILACLDFVLECLREGEAVLVMCELGKDRTGIVSALILCCCQEPMERILEDYEKSDGVGKVALAGVERMESLRGLNREMFSAAPRDALLAAFEHIDEKYGGCQGYLEAIGFDSMRQSELRQLLGAAVV